MQPIRAVAADALRTMAVGGALGLLFLGAGGRLAMRVNALGIAQPPALSVSGTITVLACGAAAGAAGALLHALSGALARLAPAAWNRPMRLAIFAALLALVTSRGLSGSPGPAWAFWLLVAAYGAALEAVLARRAHGAEGHSVLREPFGEQPT
jgi:hypothetical protein